MESPRTSATDYRCCPHFNRTMSEPAASCMWRCVEMGRSALRPPPPPPGPFTCLKGKLYPGPFASVPQSRSHSPQRARSRLLLALSLIESIGPGTPPRYHLIICHPGLQHVAVRSCCCFAAARLPLLRLNPAHELACCCSRGGGGGRRRGHAPDGFGQARFSSVDRSIKGGSSSRAAGAARDG